MIGYFKPSTGYLSPDDRRIYKTLYCSICRTISLQYGRRAALFMPSDLVFLVLVADHLNGQVDFDEHEMERCPIMPLHRVPSLSIWYQPLLQKWADLAVWLISIMFMDRATDDSPKFLTGSIYRCFWAPLFRKNRLRMRKSFPGFDAFMLDLKELLQNEPAGDRDPDGRIQPVAAAIALLLSKGLAEGPGSDTFRVAAQDTIAALYYLDALHDFTHDREKRRFNILNDLRASPHAIAEFADRRICASCRRMRELLHSGRNSPLLRHILNRVSTECAVRETDLFLKEVSI